MRSARYLLLALAGAAVLALALITALGPGDRDVAQPSATPSATVATASPATSSPASTPSASPGGRYVSALLGYSLELPPPWHRSICNGTVTQQTPVPGGEFFYGVAPRDWTASDLGSRHPQVHVFAEPNPQNVTPRAWAESGRNGGQPGTPVEDVTFAGRPAARRSPAGGPATYFVQDRGRMFVVGTESAFGAPDAATQRTIAQIIESFRFISDAEQAAARAALPPALPPRTPEQVADGVAAAFAAKNADALAQFAAPCLVTAGEQAGGSSVSREKYLDDLRAAFSAGLAVNVRARPIEGDRSAQAGLTIQSTWQDARGTVERKLMLRRGENDRWAWEGTIERLR